MKKEKQIKTGIISSMDLKKPSVKVFYGIMLFFLWVVVLVCLVPALWTLSSSVKDVKEIYAIPPTFIPKSFHPEKLLETWKNYNFVRYYLNTFIVTIGTIVFSIFSNGLAGYVISKMKPKGINIVFALIMASMMIPTNVSLVPVYKNIIDVPLLHVNLLNTFWPMILMAGANSFMIIVYKSFFDGIPTALLEAARLDGCGELRTFWNIVLPLSKPILFTAVILAFKDAWSDFFWPYMVLKERLMYTVMVEVFSLKELAIDERMIILTFSIIPPVILFCFFQKYIMQGFTMSGIKG